MRNQYTTRGTRHGERMPVPIDDTTVVSIGAATVIGAAIRALARGADRTTLRKTRHALLGHVEQGDAAARAALAWFDRDPRVRIMGISDSGAAR